MPARLRRRTLEFGRDRLEHVGSLMGANPCSPALGLPEKIGHAYCEAMLA